MGPSPSDSGLETLRSSVGRPGLEPGTTRPRVPSAVLPPSPVRSSVLASAISPTTDTVGGMTEPRYEVKVERLPDRPKHAVPGLLGGDRRPGRQASLLTPRGHVELERPGELRSGQMGSSLSVALTVFPGVFGRPGRPRPIKIAQAAKRKCRAWSQPAPRTGHGQDGPRPRTSWTRLLVWWEPGPRDSSGRLRSRGEVSASVGHVGRGDAQRRERRGDLHGLDDVGDHVLERLGEELVIVRAVQRRVPDDRTSNRPR